MSTGRHDPDTSGAERARLASLAADLCPPSCGVTTVRWESHRPLHSGRLAAALPAVVGNVVRSRGHVWLADRPGTRLRWESAGGSLSMGHPERWQATPGSRSPQRWARRRTDCPNRQEPPRREVGRAPLRLRRD